MYQSKVGQSHSFAELSLFQLSHSVRHRHVLGMDVIFLNVAGPDREGPEARQREVEGVGGGAEPGGVDRGSEGVGGGEGREGVGSWEWVGQRLQ